MKPPASSAAKDPDLRFAFDALLRASELARQEAIETGTDLVIVRDGRIVHIEAKTLREQAAAKNARAS